MLKLTNTISYNLGEKNSYDENEESYNYIGSRIDRVRRRSIKNSRKIIENKKETQW